MNVTRTWPLWVRASRGSMRPIVVVNDTRVPLCTGVPLPGVDVVAPAPGVPVEGGAGAVPCSITVATISICPLAGTNVAVGNSVITVRAAGASNGTLSQAETNGSVATAVRRARQKWWGGPGRGAGRVIPYVTLRIILSY